MIEIWREIERLNRDLNELKAGENVGSSGWIPAQEVWTRTGNTTFTLAGLGDRTGRYQMGTKLRCKQGGAYIYHWVESSSYVAPTTTVTVYSPSGAVLAAAAITDNYFSYEEHPQGFPIVKTTFGTTFPALPMADDIHYRTDLNWLCFYDGARWLTVHEYWASIDPSTAGTSVPGASGLSERHSVRLDYLPFITRFICRTYVATTNDAASYWNCALRSINLALSASTTHSNQNTSADAPDVWVSHDAVVNSAVAAANNFHIDVSFTKQGATGTPGILTYFIGFHYRLIIT